jgi:hypothetical protein
MLAASVTAAVVSPTRAFGVWPRAESNAELEAWVKERLGQADVKGIAEAWLTAHPVDSSPDAITRQISASRKPREPLGDYLSRVVVEEHRAGRAELVDGWFLAPTEARIATLVDMARR